MAFFLKRERGECFEVRGIRFEIHKISRSGVVLEISSNESFRVHYKDSTEDSEQFAEDQAKQSAENVHIGRLRFREDANHQ